MTNIYTYSSFAKMIISKHVEHDVEDEKFVAKIRRALVRMASEVQIGDSSFYDTFRRYRGGPHIITVPEFEHYLFMRWYQYLNRKHSSELRPALELDFIRISQKKDVTGEINYWDQMAQQIRESINNDIRNEMPPEEDDDLGAIVTNEELRQRGIELMIEGLFNHVCGQFRWTKLKHDMELARSISYEINSDITPEMAEAYANQYKHAPYTRKLPEF